MVVPSKNPKPSVVILHKKTYYAGAILTIIGAIALYILMSEDWTSFDNAFWKLGTFGITIIGLIMFSCSRTIKNYEPDSPFIIRSNNNSDK